MTERYDYIIAGAGAAGLSLAHHMLRPELSDRKILVVDLRLEPLNDKTWCFWHEGDPPFPDLVKRSWERGEVRMGDRTMPDRLLDHRYSCIRSWDFRRHILEELRGDDHFDLLEARIESLGNEKGRPTLRTGSRVFTAEYIFQSCLEPEPAAGGAAYPLRQHFLGWEVEAGKETFRPDRFVLMDFDETFTGGVAFIYLLPWSERRALVEYTVFSAGLLDESDYERKIELYLYNRYGIRRLDYRRTRTERGVIPMDDRIYPAWYAPGVLNVGTVGGLTKPSTGYTFTRIQRHSRQVAADLAAGRPPSPPPRPGRFHAYDLWLLQIMHERPRAALDIFEALFLNNDMDAVFAFLSERCSVARELKIMGSVPPLPFLRAIWKSRGPLLRWLLSRLQGSALPPSRKP
ncbi:MAG: lycopene cyclase family protein [Balneolaceae bacterium]|nr:lycopene cyclase family protein [Balneolaceae bacterium]